MTVYPDYDRSLVSLINSVLKFYGADCPHKTLPEMDKELQSKPKNVVVMLFDGLGSSTLAQLTDENSFMRKRKVCDVSSVFPPTTTAATTSVESGLTPFEHSWLGWNLYFKEIDDTVTVLRNKTTSGKRLKGGRIGDKYMPFKSVFERIEDADSDVQTHSLSLFSKEKVFSVAHAMRKIKRICNKKGRQFVYLYWFEPDHAMHNYGVSAKKIKRMVGRIDKNLASLSRKLKDTVAVSVADHGLIDVRWDCLAAHPQLWNMLERAPSVEPRALSLFVKKGMCAEFEKLFNDTFKDEFLLLSKDEVYQRHLLGDGEIGAKTDDFLGDFLAVATSDLCLGGETPLPMKAAHAGLTADEMTVPLVVVSRK